MAENIVGKAARTQAESIPKDTEFIAGTLKNMVLNNILNGGNRGRGGSGGTSGGGGGRPKSMQEYHNDDVRAQHDYERQVGIEGARHRQALSGLRAVHKVSAEGRVPKGFKYKGLEATYENAPTPPPATGVVAGQAEGQQQQKPGGKSAKARKKRGAGANRTYETRYLDEDAKNSQDYMGTTKTPHQWSAYEKKKRRETALSYVTKGKNLTPEQKAQNAAARTYATPYDPNNPEGKRKATSTRARTKGKGKSK
jgi:hypothetical protein